MTSLRARSGTVVHHRASALPAFDPDADRPSLQSALACGDACGYGKPGSWAPSAAQSTLSWLRLASSCPATVYWPPPVDETRGAFSHMP